MSRYAARNTEGGRNWGRATAAPSGWLLDRLEAVVLLLGPARTGRGVVVERLRGLDEGGGVGRRHRLALLLEPLGQLELGLADRGRRAVGGGEELALEDLLLLVREALPERGADHRHQRLEDVAGEVDVALHLVEFLRLDRRQRVFLPVDGAVLEREIHFGEGDGRGVGTDRL